MAYDAKTLKIDLKDIINLDDDVSFVSKKILNSKSFRGVFLYCIACKEHKQIQVITVKGIRQRLRYSKPAILENLEDLVLSGFLTKKKQGRTNTYFCNEIILNEKLIKLASEMWHDGQ